MKLWKCATFVIAAITLVGCVKKKEVVQVYPPLIIADATPLVSSTKRSIGVKVNFENIADTDYSYARFKLTAYNSEGLSVKPKKGVRESAYVRLAGPIVPGQTKSTTWTNTWANKDVQCISLDEVELIFNDGSVETAKNGRLLNKVQGHSCI
jgi:hypothetical protein